ncbi:MAG: hypothetical protein ACKO14_03935 [Armatimonadota bacterium]
MIKDVWFWSNGAIEYDYRNLVRTNGVMPIMDGLDKISPWPRRIAAAALVNDIITAVVDNHPFVHLLTKRLANVGVDIASIVDFIVIPSDHFRQDWTNAGYVRHDGVAELGFACPDAQLPSVLVCPVATTSKLYLRVESIEDFLSANNLRHVAVYGTNDADLRFTDELVTGSNCYLVQRSGARGYSVTSHPESYAEALAQTRCMFRDRSRTGDDLSDTRGAVQAFIAAEALVGTGRAVDEFFAAEREYWMSRNAAGRWQKSRQDTIGIGWANHDHHTYRSSREAFQGLIQLFLRMGFTLRERFYAGEEAGWGAQIAEHPVSRVVIFADVDITADELNTDFGITALPPSDKLGTIGLWCALHGGAIGLAGMHHLEAEFIHTIVRDSYIRDGGTVMNPFTDIEVLWQAFTSAEKWTVDSERLERLVRDGLLDEGTAQQFFVNGAPGSHLEILQRWDGFKGFNKTGISDIISKTDPRTLNQ